MKRVFDMFHTETLKYPQGSRKPWDFIEFGRTQESEEPWRSGVSAVVGVPWVAKARVIGIWTKKKDEDAFHEAAGVHFVNTPTSEVRGW